MRSPSSTHTPKTPQTQTIVWVFPPQKHRVWGGLGIGPSFSRTIVWVSSREVRNTGVGVDEWALTLGKFDFYWPLMVVAEQWLCSLYANVLSVQSSVPTMFLQFWANGGVTKGRVRPFLSSKIAQQYPLTRKYYENNPWELLFRNFKGIWGSWISRKERLFVGITRETRNFCKDNSFRAIFRK